MEDLYEEAAKDFPMIKGNPARPKSVMLSHYWSYTDIVGLYFPFFAEANVNTDLPLVCQFYNACHVRNENVSLMQARLALCLATKTVIANILEMFRINAPESM